MLEKRICCDCQGCDDSLDQGHMVSASFTIYYLTMLKVVNHDNYGRCFYYKEYHLVKFDVTAESSILKLLDHLIKLWSYDIYYGFDRHYQLLSASQVVDLTSIACLAERPRLVQFLPEFFVALISKNMKLTLSENTQIRIMQEDFTIIHLIRN